MSTYVLPFEQQFINAVSQAFGSSGEQGVDIALPQGSPLYAVTSGTVTQNLNWTAPGHPVGWAAILHGDDGNTYLYGHVSKFLANGRVVAGQQIAQSGGKLGTPGAGWSTGPHMEFQMHPGGGSAINPLPFLQRLSGGGAASPTVPASAQLASDQPQQVGGVLGLTGSNAAAFAGMPCLSLAETYQAASIPIVSGIPLVGGVQQGLGAWISWVTQACVIKRMGIGILGIALVLYGMKHLGQPGPAKTVVNIPGKIGGAAKDAALAAK